MGVPVGVVSFVYVQLLFHSGSTRKKGRPIIEICIAAFLLITTLPWIANFIATKEAEMDLSKLPVVEVIVKNEFQNNVLWNSTEANDLEIKHLLTNNKMAFFLCKASNSETDWRILSIPEESILQIVYLHE